MGEGQFQAEWYYVGHYGQLGPLTFEQMTELANDGVVAQDTYVWKPGMGDWRQASDVMELRPMVAPLTPMHLPPPVPPPAPTKTDPRQATTSSLSPAYQTPAYSSSWAYVETSVPKSDKSRTMAGLLNLIPGFGRFYLGYAAHGALQLLTAVFCMGIGFVWSVVDGIFILMGGVKYDGYGRVIQE